MDETVTMSLSAHWPWDCFIIGIVRTDNAILFGLGPITIRFERGWELPC